MEPGSEPAPRRAATLACTVVLLLSGFLLGGTARRDLLPGPVLPRVAGALVARSDAWRPWTLITTALVPRDLPSLSLSVFFLLAFGTLLETAFGPRVVLALLGGGVVGSTLLAHLWLADSPGSVPIEGAAGGVHALAGAACVLLPRMGLRVTFPIPLQAGVRNLAFFWVMLAVALENRPVTAYVVPCAQAFALGGGLLAGAGIRRTRAPAPAPDDPPPWRVAEGMRASDEWMRSHRTTRLVDDWFWLIASLAAWSFAAVLLTLAIGGWNDAPSRGTALTRLVLGLVCVGIAVAALVRWRRE